MKKVLIFGLLTLLSLGVMAQNDSRMFSSREAKEVYRGFDPEDPPNPDPGAPLGSGLLIFAGLSAGYVYLKKNKKG